MKRYKLVKEYPGSPKLNQEVPPNQYFLEVDKDKWKEYWQEVKEKEWEILSYLYDNRIFNFTKTPSFIGTEGALHYEAEDCGIIDSKTMHELSKTLVIHSVKRLSDGEVFTIGDKFSCEGDDIVFKDETIYSFILDHYRNQIIIKVSSNHTHCLPTLNFIKKAKQKLFTTEDGVDIFEGDSYFPLERSSLIYRGETTKNISLLERDFLFFSTKEKAEEYILINKPCLSMKDVMEYCEVFKTEYLITGKNWPRLTRLIKSKLNL